MRGSIAKVCYLVVPFLSTWWVHLILKEYIEGDGREVLLLGKGTFASAILLWFLNVICIFPMMFIEIEYKYQYRITYLMLELIIISFFMNGVAYFLNYLTRSITISMRIIIFYTALSNYTFRHEQLSVVFRPIQLVRLEDVPYEDSYNGYIKFVVAGVLFWIFGFLKSKKIQ